ncbi:hypothetical protein DMH17_01990 [Raoultella planticola]|nr:hypothetical protein [Raoultella planticola]
MAEIIYHRASDGHFLAGTATAGVRPQLTRIAAYAQDRETPVDVINDSQGDLYGAGLGRSSGNDNDLPLVLTPPVMKLEAKKNREIPDSWSLREGLRRTESAYWLSLGNTAKSRQCK